MTTIQNIQGDAFESTISDGIVLVDFWAPGCNSCKLLGMILDQIAKELPETVKIVKIDVNAEKELAKKHNISTLPTLALYKGGRLVNVRTGVQTKAKILELIANA